LFVLERDPILYRHLLEVFREREGVKIEKKNVLKISFQDYLEPQEHRLSVIGNLPYAITSPILIHLVRERAFLSEAVVTMQREVSERLRAKPRTKSYSSFTCLLQCFADIEPKFRIPRNVFYPQPNVESEVVRLRFLAKPRVSPKDLDFMIRIIRTGFRWGKSPPEDCPACSAATRVVLALAGIHWHIAISPSAPAIGVGSGVMESNRAGPADARSKSCRSSLGLPLYRTTPARTPNTPRIVIRPPKRYGRDACFLSVAMGGFLLLISMLVCYWDG
ncbi:MAG: hypothetical protein IH935_08955, partial [Acidobacteria bacterium]|nr:hypothetical protein [Acidobacteriota bacterium]